MFIYDRLTKLNELLPSVREKLADALNSNQSWKILANHYARSYELDDLVPSIENEQSENPGEVLLCVLDEHECDIEMLCHFLKECQMHKSLIILQNPMPPRIIVQPTADIASIDKSIEIELGPLYLRCRAEGVPPPYYQWLHKDNVIRNGIMPDLNTDIESDLQEGKYICKVYQLNETDEIINEVYSDPVFVKIKESPICIIKQPPAFLEIEQNHTMFLDCKATSHPSPSYQWYKDGKKLDTQSKNKLLVSNFSPSKEGRYHCVISNGLNKAHTNTSIVMTQTGRETATLKVGLLVANQNYRNQSVLKTPRDEVAAVAKVLKELGFHVICLTDLTLSQMQNAVNKFCEYLTEGAYGVYYYAGHGIESYYKFMWPIDVPAVNYKYNDMLSENWLFSKCLAKNPALVVVILDMCLSTPDKNDNPEMGQSPLVDEYKNNRNLIVAYSTSSFLPSYEVNSSKKYETYSSILCKYLSQNLTADKVIDLVGKSYDVKIKGKRKSDQIPKFTSSLVKPYRLTDKVVCDEEQKKINKQLKSLLCLPRSWTFTHPDNNIKFQVEISPFIEPFSNFLQLRVYDLDDRLRVEFFQSEESDYNYLSIISIDKCVVQCPRTTPGTILINVCEKNKRKSLGSVALPLATCFPLLKNIYKNAS